MNNYEFIIGVRGDVESQNEAVQEAILELNRQIPDANIFSTDTFTEDSGRVSGVSLHFSTEQDVDYDSMMRDFDLLQTMEAL